MLQEIRIPTTPMGLGSWCLAIVSVHLFSNALGFFLIKKKVYFPLSLYLAQPGGMIFFFQLSCKWFAEEHLKINHSTRHTVWTCYLPWLQFRYWEFHLVSARKFGWTKYLLNFIGTNEIGTLKRTPEHKEWCSSHFCLQLL